ncbi:MAG: hypothetical protein ACE5H1_10505, partial [Thermodesulfobacteriota bacterium]
LTPLHTMKIWKNYNTLYIFVLLMDKNFNYLVLTASLPIKDTIPLISSIIISMKLLSALLSIDRNSQSRNFPAK